MILDVHADLNRTRVYQAIDAVTDERITEPIIYADDETGIYRVLLKDADGRYLLNADRTEVAWEERVWCNGFRFRLCPEFTSEAHGRAWWQDQEDRVRQGFPSRFRGFQEVQ
jgi:hypothetical protein